MRAAKHSCHTYLRSFFASYFHVFISFLFCLCLFYLSYFLIFYNLYKHSQHFCRLERTALSLFLIRRHTRLSCSYNVLRGHGDRLLPRFHQRPQFLYFLLLLYFLKQFLSGCVFLLFCIFWLGRQHNFYFKYEMGRYIKKFI